MIQLYQATLSFHNQIAPDWELTAFVGGSYQRTDFTHVGVGTWGNSLFPDFWSLANSDGWPAQRDNRVQSYRREAEAIYRVLGQVLLNFRDTYYFEIQAANDWASTLPRANRSFFYPGASFTWVFTEDFDIPFMDIGRFRLSWADVGRPAPRYFALRTFEMTTLDAPNTHIHRVIGPYDLFVGDLMPERRREWETGFNVRMFNNRLEVDFAYYNNINYNEIMRVPLSQASGAGFIRLNAGAVQRQGVELSINATPVHTRHFNWNMRFNMARQWDQIRELHPGIDQISTEINGIFLVHEVGQPMGNLWMQDYVRDPYGNRVVGPTGMWQRTTNPAYRINMGSIFPDFYGGLSQQFGFRGRWGEAVLSAGLDYRVGGQVLSMSNVFMRGNGLSEESLRFRDAAHGGLAWTDGYDRSRHDGVIKPGVIRVGEGEYRPNDIIIPANVYHSRHLTDMRDSWSTDALQRNNFVKLRDVSVSYSFPRGITNSLRLERLTLSLQARNLFYIYKSINNIDAQAMLGTHVSDQWIENSVFPMSRFLGFRVNVAF
jgi:iron complex outermembrane receptor protein